MLKKSFLSILIIGCSLLFASCSDKNASSNHNEINHSNSIDESSEPYEISEDSSSDIPLTLNENIKRIQVATDEVGIYGVTIYLSNKIADKGDLEFIYKGAKSSPQKDSIIATFTLNYWTEPTGYEVKTFYNKDVYQNFHKLEEIKFVMDFGATIRAGDVTIYYTPDDGNKEQIFYSDEACYYHN